MSGSSTNHFADRLSAAVERCRTPVVVGLDPRWARLPDAIRRGGDDVSGDKRAAGYAQFCRGIIDVVAPLVPAVKPQSAFFEELGPPGAAALFEVMEYARAAGLLVILDAKRNDIGSTAEAYARGYLAGAWPADALTVTPFLGDDSVEPFAVVAQRYGKGVFVLVKTSNPGGEMIQNLVSHGKPVYRYLAEYVENLAGESVGACGYGSIGAVVGATYPEQLVELRAAMPRTWFLVPGFGAQGGTAADVAAAFDARGLGAVVNSSRAIIFAHHRDEYRERFGDARWQDAVEAATLEMIDQLRSATPGGVL